MPRITFSDIYTNKPGAMLARVPNFTSGQGLLYDMRGWVYVHLDEALEMVAVRLLKGLNVLMLPYLESAGAWLLIVSRARMTIRTVTSSARSYQRRRNEDFTETSRTVTVGYDRNCVQTSTVQTMIILMREKGFLSLEHRNCQKLTNVFGEKYEGLDDKELQQLILQIDSHGRTNVELHASAMFPDIFGNLSDVDVEMYLNGKRPKGEWTKQRQVPTAGRSMRSQREEKGVSSNTKQDGGKTLSERKNIINKLMITLTLHEHNARSDEDIHYARQRWRTVLENRFLLSELADAYRASNCETRHASKSKILPALNLEFVDDGCFNEESSPTKSPTASLLVGKNVSFYHDFTFSEYGAVMIDLMNHIWSRGRDGTRGNSLFQLTILKLKSFLRTWFSGRRAKKLQQLHLHIDDPTNIIPQKNGEQTRRDNTKNVSKHVIEQDDLSTIGFHLPVSLPWGNLIGPRLDRDTICSLHLFCGAAAAMELCEEYGLDVTIYMHGGCFILSDECVGKQISEIVPEVASRYYVTDEIRDGEVLLASKNIIKDKSNENEELSARYKDSEGARMHSSAADSTLLEDRNNSSNNITSPREMQLNPDNFSAIPRNCVLKVNKADGFRVADVVLSHGESETRFVASFKKFIAPVLGQHDNSVDEMVDISSNSSTLPRCSCIFISKDTDVTMILSLAKELRNKGCIHINGDSVIDIDKLLANLERIGLTSNTLAAIYVLGGCDFTPGTYRVTHETYLKAAVRHRSTIGNISMTTNDEVFEILTLLAYLEKRGFRFLTTAASKRTTIQLWKSAGVGDNDLSKRTRQFFISEHPVATKEWSLDVRRFVAEEAKTTSQLIPPGEHISLQSKRTKFIVFKYWSNSAKDLLDVDFVEGCNEHNGFTNEGAILLEREQDKVKLRKQMKELVAICRCKQTCYKTMLLCKTKRKVCRMRM